MSHAHVSVFHGPRESFNPGLVIHSTASGWDVVDEMGHVSPEDTVHGTFPTEAEACRAALRVLRARLSEPVIPCWGAGAPNKALAELGYDRGQLRWRWWPPRLVRVGESVVGIDGRPATRICPAISS